MKYLSFIFPLIVASLLLAVWSGWVRIGISIPVTAAAGHHGALMVNSFLASLIFLERAVTFKQKWVLCLPTLNALSGVFFFLGNTAVAQLLLLFGSGGYVIMCIYFSWKYRELYYIVFLAGASCLLCGNLIVYKTHFYPGAVVWWVGFLLFTIVAERLELSRFLPIGKKKKNFLILCLTSFFLALFWPGHWKGNLALGITIAAIALWLLKYDMARHSIKLKGPHRYSGLMLITGYFWLLIMSVLLTVQDFLLQGYDAVLHSFFVGFVFSMIFSHAPVILPAVTKKQVKIYRPFLYVWFIVLQLSLLIRIIGDITGNATSRMMGGLVNGLTILLFLASVALIFIMELRKLRLRSAKA